MNIYIPFIGMMVLTLSSVDCYVYKRLTWIVKTKAKPTDIDTPEKLSAAILESVNHASNNLKNLFELPVIFYVVCIYLVTSNQIDNIYIYCAYSFLGLRILHSLIHCTVNHVNTRFSLYICSSIALWIMVIRCGYALI